MGCASFIPKIEDAKMLTSPSSLSVFSPSSLYFQPYSLYFLFPVFSLSLSRGQEHGNITERTRVLRGNQARNTERILRIRREHSSEEETRPWRGDGVRNQKGKKERTWREYEEKTMQGRNTERMRRSRMRGDEAKNREVRNTERIRREYGEKTRPRIRKEYGDNDTRNERNGYFSQNDDRKVPSRTSSDNLNR